MRKLLITSMVLFPLFVWTFGYAEDPWQSHYWMGPWSFGFGACFLIPVMMIAFWIAVIVGIVYFVRWVIAAGKGREIKQEETALDILKKRYAKGEISKEEFERMKQDIS